MTFAFYHSLITQPRDLDEAARIMRLTKWERFWKLDVPSGMIPLVWNGMMSFGGAWFFLAASESISVLNHTYALPGIGSYVAAAVEQASLSQVGIAIVVMVVMVIARQRPVLAADGRLGRKVPLRGVRGGRAPPQRRARPAAPLRGPRPDQPRRCARSAGRWTRSPGRSAWPSIRCSARRSEPAPGTCSSRRGQRGRGLRGLAGAGVRASSHVGLGAFGHGVRARRRDVRPGRDRCSSWPASSGCRSACGSG